MEDLDIALDRADLAEILLSRFQNSPRDDHQHLCAVVGAMSQTLKDQKIPLTPVAYFGAAASSLDRLSRDPSAGSDPVAAALLSFLSTILSRVPPAVLSSKRAFLSESLVRILGCPGLSAGGVKAGLKCVSHLLVAGEKANFSSVSPLYGVILGFLTDERSKVRKQSHSSLRDVLQSFQGSTALMSASKGVKLIFERCLLLAGGSKSTDSAPDEGPKGALEVLYILNALKDCLPLMSMKFANIILEYCKSLLDLQQPIVTRNVMEILHALCCSPSSEVSPQVLLDLLCSLASSANNKETSADGMASTARLLHVGTKKVYDLNRELCIVKLPILFSSLGDIFATEHEEAVFAAKEALKGLLSSCIDEGLVKQGVEQVTLYPEGGIRQSGPTIIEKICATIEGFLGFQYSAVWDMSFQVLSTAFEYLGNYSSYLMAATIRSLADMEKLPDEDFPYRKQLHECVGSAIGALGPEIFLNILPLNLDGKDMVEANVWLIPILKQFVVGARLSYFTHHILNQIRFIQKKSHKLEKEGQIFSARSADGLVYSLWSLLPAFCNYPVDTSRSFKDLQKVLCTTLRQEPDLRGIICTSLQILIRQNTGILSENLMPGEGTSEPERNARYHYTLQVAEENLAVIGSFSSDFFSVLSEIVFEDPKDSGGYLQSTIHEFASIPDKKAVKKFFKNTMKRLLEVTQKTIQAKQFIGSNSMQVDSLSGEPSLSRIRALLLDLAVALLPGLGKEECDLLFNVIKPGFQDEEGIIQKKAYKILSIILKESDEFLSRNMDILLELMIAALPFCHSSAKRHRLDSLYFLIVYISKYSSEQRKRDVIIAFLTEVILALKEVNKKTRNRAYDLLVEIGHACLDEEQGGTKENLQQYFNMIAGGLAGETPHMISAALKGLARLAYEFSDLIGAAYNVLPSAYLLLQRKNREIVKANLGLIKVLVAKSGSEGLQVHLRGIVEGLLKWQDDTKNHFKAKVKLLLEMLVRKCGLDAVNAVMPEEHMKLLSNIRKIKERKERKARTDEDSESLHSRSSVSRQSKWNHTRIFSDFGDEDEDDDSDADHKGGKINSGRWSKASSRPGSKASSRRSIRMHQASKSLPEDFHNQIEDDPLDLLDRQRTRSAVQSSSRLKRKPEDFDEPEIDPDGRIVVREGGNKPKDKNVISEHRSDTRSQASIRTSAKSREQRKRVKTSDSGWAYAGNEYSSKKASGDVKKKDKLDPYAYWPLDRKLLNRRSEHKATARKGMATVMKFTKRLQGTSASAALKGIKMKRTQRKKGGKKSR